MNFSSDYSNHHPINPLNPTMGDLGKLGVQQPKQESLYQEHTYSIPTNSETSIKGNSAFQECDNEFAKQVISPQLPLDNQAMIITDLIKETPDIEEEEDLFGEDESQDLEKKDVLSKISTKEKEELKKIVIGEEVETQGKQVEFTGKQAESTGEKVEATGEEKKAEGTNEQEIFIDKVSKNKNYSNVFDEKGNPIFSKENIVNAESQLEDLSSTNLREGARQLFDIIIIGKTLYKFDEEGNLVPMTAEQIEELRESFTKDVTEYFQNKFPLLANSSLQTKKEEEAEVKPSPTFKLFDLSKDIKDKQDAVSETPPKFGKRGRRD